MHLKNTMLSQGVLVGIPKVWGPMAEGGFIENLRYCRAGGFSGVLVWVMAIPNDTIKYRAAECNIKSRKWNIFWVV